MAFLKSVLNFFIYTNLWIAASAIVLCLQTQYLLTHSISISKLIIFVFFSTLLLYAVHRLVGLRKIDRSQPQARFEIIARYRLWLIASAIIAAITCAIIFFQFERALQFALFLPMIAAVGYAIPLFPTGKRLRDFSYVKIFLIALSWGWVTVIMPSLELHLFPNIPAVVMFLERCCFIFAIALPFDIRDLPIDRADGVRTLPGTLGVKKAKWLAYMALMLMLIFGWLNVQLDAYDLSNWLGLCISGLLTATLIYFAKEERSDYYFTGLIDSMLLLQLLLMMV